MQEEIERRQRENSISYGENLEELAEELQKINEEETVNNFVVLFVRSAQWICSPRASYVYHLNTFLTKKKPCGSLGCNEVVKNHNKQFEVRQTLTELRLCCDRNIHCVSHPLLSLHTSTTFLFSMNRFSSLLKYLCASGIRLYNFISFTSLILILYLL
jgi:hypothetical protein